MIVTTGVMILPPPLSLPLQLSLYLHWWGKCAIRLWHIKGCRKRKSLPCSFPHLLPTGMQPWALVLVCRAPQERRCSWFCIVFSLAGQLLDYVKVILCFVDRDLFLCLINSSFTFYINFCCIIHSPPTRYFFSIVTFCPPRLKWECNSHTKSFRLWTFTIL